MNLDGGLVLLESGKGFSRARISRFILEHGRPAIVASDKRPAPKVLGRFASSFSARLAYPEENTSRLEKARMARRFDLKVKNKTDGPHVWKNQHEKDALVAVLLAWRNVVGLMNRVDAKLNKFRRREDFEEMKDFVKAGTIASGMNIDSLLKKFAEGK